MKREEVIRLLNARRTELMDRYGVKSLALFGSAARDETSQSSDVDLLVEFNRPAGLFALFSLQDRLEELLGCPVDLGTLEGIKPRLRSRLLQECLHVFPVMG